MDVKKRNGRLEKLNVDKINKVVERACESLDGVSSSEIILDAQIKLYDKVKTSEIDDALISCSAEKINKDPNYSFVAARLFLATIYKSILKESVDADTFSIDYKTQFVKNIKSLVKTGFFDERLLGFDLTKISNALIPENDLKLKYLGVKALDDRYLFKHDSKRYETPQYLFMRVAMGLCLNEKNKEDEAIKLYGIYSNLLALPATPVLLNSGKIHSQTASCYLSINCDSIDGIFDSLHQEARKSKWAGGLGISVTPLRASGSYIKGTNGKSSGLIPWLKLYESTVMAVNQGGSRPGAIACYLEPFHLDYHAFLELRRINGDEWQRTHNLNTASWICDEFMNRVKENKDWYFFNPSDFPELHEKYGKDFSELYNKAIQKAEKGEVIFKKEPAKEVWKKQLKMLFETGFPWLCFKCPSNIRYSNRHDGIIHSSNLCTEIEIQTSSSKYNKDGEKTETGQTGVCQLSSINLPTHVENGKINWKKLENTIKILVRSLDNAIDINFYPTKESKKHIELRPLGLGEMGFQDLCHSLNIIYDSDEGVQLAKKVQEFISYHSVLTSSLLAKERGVYSTYKGSLWDNGILPHDSYFSSQKERGLEPFIKLKDVETLEWDFVRKSIKENGMRNMLVQAIAPTASISYISGCEQSIEPNYSVIYVYKNLSGNNYIINAFEYFKKDMVKEGLWNTNLVKQLNLNDGDVSQLNIPDFYKKKYATAFNRNFNKLIECAVMRQIYIDQSQSFNIWYSGDSLKEVNDIYFKCWESGLKSTYYFRNSRKGGVKTVVEQKDNESAKKEVCILGEGCTSCQ